LAQVEDQFQGLAQGKERHPLPCCRRQLDVMADRGACLQILSNLVGNALKFSKAKTYSCGPKSTAGGFRFG